MPHNGLYSRCISYFLRNVYTIFHSIHPCTLLPVAKMCPLSLHQCQQLLQCVWRVFKFLVKIDEAVSLVIQANNFSWYGAHLRNTEILPQNKNTERAGDGALWQSVHPLSVALGSFIVLTRGKREKLLKIWCEIAFFFILAITFVFLILILTVSH